MMRLGSSTASPTAQLWYIIWLSMVIYGYLWLSMVIYGFLWLSMVFYGYKINHSEDITWKGNVHGDFLLSC